MSTVNEQIRFRVFQMPCCGQMLCWVNPRLPTHCPECGTSVLMELRTGIHTLLTDENAWIKYKTSIKMPKEQRR
jgi:hypothetical protein